MDVHTYETIGEALSFIPAHDRDTWLRMAMAVKSALGREGFDLWNEWSKQAPSYNARHAHTVWKSIRANGKVTAGTLFHEAKAHGWRDDGTYRKPTPEELEAQRRIAAERAAKEGAGIARECAEAAKKAAAIWKAASPATEDHPYLTKKGVKPVSTLREIPANQAAAILDYAPESSGELLSGRLLVAPVKVGDALSTLELIDPDGRKSALAGRGTKAGGYWAAQPLPDSNGDGLALLIGEGVATVLTAKEASGHTSVAALSAGNLPAVMKAMRQRYPAAVHVALADLVKATGAPDPHAIEAARAVGGLLAIPDFGTVRPDGAKDFNDMAQLCGIDAVMDAIANAKAPGGSEHRPGPENAPAGDSASREWLEPLPLAVKVEPEPYPLDALPDTIRAAVEEVQGFTKAPIPLVASSALAALSLAIQAHADVKRADKLSGPVGLFLLTIADSGERKSTCDGFFTAAIRDYEQEQAEAGKPEINRHAAELSAWTAEREGLLLAIRQTRKSGKPTDALKSELAQTENGKPTAPRIPKLKRGDETPENLAWLLAREWPSAGVLSSEAGIIFGAHGMGRESIMRNLALLNVLWAGGAHSVGRRTSRGAADRGAASARCYIAQLL